MDPNPRESSSQHSLKEVLVDGVASSEPLTGVVPGLGPRLGLATGPSPPCCAVCSKRDSLIPLKSLPPVVLPIVRAARPTTTQPKTAKSNHVCVPCLRTLLSSRLHSLVEEDARATGELGDAVMRNLGEWEQTEGGWQKKFERSRTFGERAADAVAARGGSWRLVRE